VCLDAPADYLVTPCGHQCGCQPCLAVLQAMQQPRGELGDGVMTTEWSCTACTFLNPANTAACSTCGRPCAAAGGAGGGGSMGAGGSGAGGCPVCRAPIVDIQRVFSAGYVTPDVTPRALDMLAKAALPFANRPTASSVVSMVSSSPLFASSASSAEGFSTAASGTGQSMSDASTFEPSRRIVNFPTGGLRGHFRRESALRQSQRNAVRRATANGLPMPPALNLPGFQFKRYVPKGSVMYARTKRGGRE
jgi:hypothetical protein